VFVGRIAPLQLHLLTSLIQGASRHKFIQEGKLVCHTAFINKLCGKGKAEDDWGGQQQAQRHDQSVHQSKPTRKTS
jgi:hypothetical protein